MRLTNAKKNKEREKREMEATNRKHLANMRVVQKNLVYVVGLSPKFAREEFIPTLKGPDYFGQYGRVAKILISKRMTSHKYGHGSHDPSIGVYVTYQSKEDAARAIVAIDGSKEPGGRMIRASYGTTKYCTSYLRNMPCANPGCTYLHEPGEEADSFTKEDLATLRHAAKDTEHKIKPASMHLMPITKKATESSMSMTGSPASTHVSAATSGTTATTSSSATTAPTSHSDTGAEGSALPRTASWATAGKLYSTPEQTHAQPVSASATQSPPLLTQDPHAFPGLAAAMKEVAKPMPSPKARPKSMAKPAVATASSAPAGKTNKSLATDSVPSSPTTSFHARDDGPFKASSRDTPGATHERHHPSLDAVEPPSLFSTVDWTLSSLSDGDFSFHLPSLPPASTMASTTSSNLLAPSTAMDAQASDSVDDHDTGMYTSYNGTFNPFDEHSPDVSWASIRAPPTADTSTSSSGVPPPGLFYEQRRTPLTSYHGAADVPWFAQPQPQTQTQTQTQHPQALLPQLQPQSSLAEHQSLHAYQQHAMQRAAVAAAMPPMPSVMDSVRAPEEQRSAAAAMLAARARQLQEAGENVAAHSMSDVRTNLARQQAQAKNGDSQSLLALLRRIQDVPPEHASGTPPPESVPAVTPPPGLRPSAAPQPNMATGLLLAQLLGTPPAKHPAEGYAGVPVLKQT